MYRAMRYSPRPSSAVPRPAKSRVPAGAGLSWLMAGVLHDKKRRALLQAGRASARACGRGGRALHAGPVRLGACQEEREHVVRGVEVGLELLPEEDVPLPSAGEGGVEFAPALHPPGAAVLRDEQALRRRNGFAVGCGGAVHEAVAEAFLVQDVGLSQRHVAGLAHERVPQHVVFEGEPAWGGSGCVRVRTEAGKRRSAG